MTIVISLSANVFSVPVEAGASHDRGVVGTARSAQYRHPTLAQVLAEPFVASIDALPPRDTYASIKRIRYEPGVEFSEQPIDGPKVLIVESGKLTIETAKQGAMIVPVGESVRDSRDLAPGRNQEMEQGAIALIPAGMPIQLANRSMQAVEWVQAQIETPAAVCSCGEDLTGVRVEVLSSDTLPSSVAAPAVLSFCLDRLLPGQILGSSAESLVRLVGVVDGTGPKLSYSDDGTVRNPGEQPIDIFLFTVTSASPTT